MDGGMSPPDLWRRSLPQGEAVHFFGRDFLCDGPSPEDNRRVADALHDAFLRLFLSVERSLMGADLAAIHAAHATALLTFHGFAADVVEDYLACRDPSRRS